jgi:predicted ATPase
VEALRTLVAEVGVTAVRELVGPSWPELARLLPALGAADRPGPPDQAAQARLFELLLGLFGRLSEQTPLVLVVEDVHWSDQSTRDLLAFLVRNLRWERILVVVTYRNDEPGQQQLGPYLAELDRGGPVQRLELPRLDQAQTGAQLVGILGAAPPAELVDALFARSEGNPFFTEELLAAVRAGSGELPATLRDLLRGRVEALPEHARDMLEVAAVAGRRVSHRLLASVAGIDDQQLVEGLRAAVTSQRGWLRLSPRPTPRAGRRRPAARRTGPAARRLRPRPHPEARAGRHLASDVGRRVGRPLGRGRRGTPGPVGQGPGR